jgi:predicted RNase H-like HicB family nuclease
LREGLLEMADEPTAPVAQESGARTSVEIRKKWVGADAVPSQDPGQATTQRDRIVVVIQRVAEDYFIATDETTQHFGEGDTAAEAMDALLDVLREYLAALQDSDPVLFPDQKRHLAHLASLSVL